MAKRFTDTGKWKRPWFRDLGLHAKVLWQYICDDCDHAGVWIADFNLVSFQVGFKVDRVKLRDWLGDKLVQIDADKFFVPSFFEFQYGNSDSGFRAKQGAIRELAKYGLIDPESGVLITLTNSYLSVNDTYGTLLELQGIGTGKGNTVLDPKNEQRVTNEDLESVYQLYPRKEGKSDGLRIARAQIKTLAELADLRKAIERYTAKLKVDGTDKKYIKHFGTFMAKWRDCLEPDYGTSEDFSSTTGDGVSISKMIANGEVAG